MHKDIELVTSDRSQWKGDEAAATKRRTGQADFQYQDPARLSPSNSSPRIPLLPGPQRKPCTRRR